MKFQLAVTVLVTLAVTGTAHAQSVEGLFRPSGATWSCSPDQTGMDGGALAIQNGVFNGVENRCDLTSPVVLGESTSYTAVCFAEGSEHHEDVSIMPTANGIKLERNGATTYWTRCDEGDQPTTREVARNTAEQWEYSDRTAFVIADGNQFALSCEIFNATSTYPTASMNVPCPLCFPQEMTTYTLRIDDTFDQAFEFERISNAEGSVSRLDYYPNWREGLVPALMSGNTLSIVEAGSVVAAFPLTGSSRAISTLREQCS